MTEQKNSLNLPHSKYPALFLSKCVCNTYTAVAGRLQIQPGGFGWGALMGYKQGADKGLFEGMLTTCMML